jgi:lipoyl(octanoyl) transferase
MLISSLSFLKGNRQKSDPEFESNVQNPACSFRHGEWVWLGRVPYQKAFQLQEELRKQVSGGDVDVLLLLEHDPVITLGRNANPSNILSSREKLTEYGIDIIRTNRGGDVTFHGPGQLVGYPIFCLRRGVRAHIKAMVDGIIDTLGQLGIVGEWRDSHPGVWVGEEKICAVGIHVHHGVSIHGFALNVDIELASFQHIVPCGLKDVKVTSMYRQLGTIPSMEAVVERLVHSFMTSFEKPLLRIPTSSSRLQIADGNL